MLWINVKNEMPTEEGYYLCYGKSTRSKVVIRYCNLPNQKSAMQFWVNGSKDKHITHWAPLPEIPEEEPNLKEKENE